MSLTYGSWTAITISLGGLANSATAGRESTLVDNTSDLFDDVLIAGKIQVGTTPTAGTQILVYALAIHDDSAWPDVFDGTDSDETPTSPGVERGYLKGPIATLEVTTNDSDRYYPFGPVALAQFFGGVIPTKWGLFVRNSSGAALNATGGNHVIKRLGITG